MRYKLPFIVGMLLTTALAGSLWHVRERWSAALIAKPIVVASKSQQHLVPSPSLEPKPPCDIPTEALKPTELFKGLTLTVSQTLYSYQEARGTSGEMLRTFTDPEKQIGLRVLNTQTCANELVIITKKGAQLIAPRGWDIEAVRRANGIQWNNWATEFHIQQPEHEVVVQVLYPLVEGAGKSRTITLIDYHPYSQELATPELVSAGQKYLADLASQALGELRTLKVPSRAFPGRLLADTAVARPEVSARLGAIEHMDLGEFTLDQLWTTERVFTSIGLNRDRFAQNTCSPAAACGLMQFTDNGARDSHGVLQPGTYTLLRKAYPQAHLIADFTQGASDPKNAMIASYLHHDNILRVLVENFGPRIVDNIRVLDELVGGGYNGGPTYVVRAYQASLKSGKDWIAALPTCRGRERTDCIPVETVGYVMKLRYLQNEWKGSVLAKR